MAEKREITHPLSRQQFYAECFRYATTGAWGVMGEFSTGVPLAALVFKKFAPHWYTVAAHFLQTHGLNDDWLILAPAVVGGLILIGRLATAPFVLYRDKPSADGAVRSPLMIAATLPAYDSQIQELYDDAAALHGALDELKSAYDNVKAELSARTDETVRFAKITARLNATLRNRALELVAELRDIKSKVEAKVPDIVLDIPEWSDDMPPGSRGTHAKWRVHRSMYLTSQRNLEVDQQCKAIYTTQFAARVDALNSELQAAEIPLAEMWTATFFWDYIASVATVLAAAAEKLR